MDSGHETGLCVRGEDPEKISRFFAKVFGEALHLCADTLCFTLTAEEVRGQVLRGAAELKLFTLKPGWFDGLYEELAARCSWLLGELGGFPETGASGTPGLLAAADQLVLYRLKKKERVGGERRFMVTALAARPRSELVSALQLADAARPQFGRLMDHAPGLLIIAAPGPEQARAASAVGLALSGAHYVGSIEDAAARGGIEALSAERYIAASVEQADALEALLKLREFGCNLDVLRLRGVLCAAFVKRTCQSCGRQAVLDQKLIETLPPPLRPHSAQGYLVGRGCLACGQRGYKGLVGLQSIIADEQGEVAELLRRGCADRELAAELYPRGLRSLMQDAVPKVMHGQSTFEALFEVVRTIPPAYLSLLKEPPQEAGLAGDFFSEQQAGQPALRGPAAFMPEQQSREAQASPDAGAAGAAKSREKPLLLVVEDDPDQRSIMQMVFSAAGYQIRTAGNGREALESLTEVLPDLIVTDLMMPEMDGAQLVARLRAHPGYRKIPILVLTVVADGEKEYKLLDLGADDYCEKNIQRKILLKRIQNLLRRQGR